MLRKIREYIGYLHYTPNTTIKCPTCGFEWKLVGKPQPCYKCLYKDTKWALQHIADKLKRGSGD